MEKDFTVKVRVYNRRILAAIKKAGHKSISTFCKANSLQYQGVVELANFSRSPLSSVRLDGWSEVAAQLSTALSLEPEDLWPEHLAKIKKRQGCVEFDVDADEISSLQHDRKYFDVAAMNKLMKGLTGREMTVLSHHFGFVEDGTLDSIGKMLGVQRERVRQIETKALRKMKRNAEINHIDSVDDVMFTE